MDVNVSQAVGRSHRVRKLVTPKYFESQRTFCHDSATGVKVTDKVDMTGSLQQQGHADCFVCCIMDWRCSIGVQGRPSCADLSKNYIMQ